MLIHAVSLLLRFTGGLMLIAAGFLRETEEGKIQNRLEEAWIRVHDARTKALSVTAAFVREVARLSLSFFNALFGTRLISYRAAGVSICLSTSSFFFFALAMILIGHQRQPIQQWVLAWCFAVGFLLLGVYPAFKKPGERLWIWWAALVLIFGGAGYLLIVVTQLLEKLWGVVSALKFTIFFVFCLTYSFMSDFLYVAATRWMLSLVSKAEGVVKSVGLLLLNTLLGVFLFAVPVVLGVLAIWKLDFKSMGVGIAGASTFNFLDLVACSIFFVLALLMLIHRLFWPLIERPIYSLQRYAFQKKAWLWAVGGALLLHPPGLTGLLARIVGRLLKP